MITRDDYNWGHLKFYFFCIFMGLVIFIAGWVNKVYDIYGNLIKAHCMPPMVIGSLVIILAFIGIIFFSDNKD